MVLYVTRQFGCQIDGYDNFCGLWHIIITVIILLKRMCVEPKHTIHSESQPEFEWIERMADSEVVSLAMADMKECVFPVLHKCITVNACIDPPIWKQAKSHFTHGPVPLHSVLGCFHRFWEPGNEPNKIRRSLPHWNWEKLAGLPLTGASTVTYSILKQNVSVWISNSLPHHPGHFLIGGLVNTVSSPLEKLSGLMSSPK